MQHAAFSRQQKRFVIFRQKCETCYKLCRQWLLAIVNVTYYYERNGILSSNSFNSFLNENIVIRMRICIPSCHNKS